MGAASFIPPANSDTKESTFPHASSFAAFMFVVDVNEHLVASFITYAFDMSVKVSRQEV